MSILQVWCVVHSVLWWRKREWHGNGPLRKPCWWVHQACKPHTSHMHTLLLTKRADELEKINSLQHFMNQNLWKTNRHISESAPFLISKTALLDPPTWHYFNRQWTNTHRDISRQKGQLNLMSLNFMGQFCEQQSYERQTPQSFLNSVGLLTHHY